MFDFYNTRNEKAFIIENMKSLVHYIYLILSEAKLDMA